MVKLKHLLCKEQWMASPDHLGMLAFKEGEATDSCWAGCGTIKARCL